MFCCGKYGTHRFQIPSVENTKALEKNAHPVPKKAIRGI
jgi:hypothetical protein